MRVAKDQQLIMAGEDIRVYKFMRYDEDTDTWFTLISDCAACKGLPEPGVIVKTKEEELTFYPCPSLLTINRDIDVSLFKLVGDGLLRCFPAEDNETNLSDLLEPWCHWPGKKYALWEMIVPKGTMYMEGFMDLKNEHAPMIGARELRFIRVVELNEGEDAYHAN